MQKTDSNSLEKYIRAKNRQNDAKLVGEAGCSCLGAPIGTGGGVSAVEAVPTVNVFPVCSAAECLDSGQDLKFTSPNRGSAYRNKTGDPENSIIGQLEAVPGESSLSAAAYETIYCESIKPERKGFRYNANDFTPYAKRFR